MSGTSTRQGEVTPVDPSRQRSSACAAALLFGTVLLASAATSDVAFAQPTEPAPATETPAAAAPAAAAPAAEAATATPTTGAPFDEATPAQKAAATEAYQDGVEAMDGQQYDQALAKFRESYGIVASPNSRLMVVRALAEAGRHAEAHEEAVIAVKECEAAAAKDPKYEKAAVGAREELSSLEAKIARVTVNVTGAPKDATLTVAGKAIDPSQWGQQLTVAPGDVEVALTTTAGTETKKVTVAAGSAQAIDIAPAKPKAKAKPKNTKPAQQQESGFQWPDRRLMAYAAGGLGALGLVNLGIFGMLSNSRMIRLEDQCDNDDNCAEGLVDEANAGKTYTALANVGLIVGIIGVSAGAGLFVWDLMDPDEDRAGTIVRPRVALGPGSLAVTGSF